jgi:uncharacterized protein YkwD
LGENPIIRWKTKMDRRTVLALGGAAALSACVTSQPPQLGADGKPLPRVVMITPDEAQKIPYRLLDSVNSLRQAKGAAPLNFNAALNAASLTHARDMSVQNRPWHFGSDGSSPLVRVQRVGYTGELLGELISETYQTDLETLSAWMGQPDTRAIILDPRATNMGFGWYQEQGGKVWWTLLTAR